MRERARFHGFRENPTGNRRVNGNRDLQMTPCTLQHARVRRTRVSLSYIVACTEMTATGTAILYVRASGTATRLNRREVKRSEVSRLYDVDVRSFSFRITKPSRSAFKATGSY